jgi:hypothetical protein
MNNESMKKIALKVAKNIISLGADDDYEYFLFLIDNEYRLVIRGSKHNYYFEEFSQNKNELINIAKRTNPSKLSPKWVLYDIHQIVKDMKTPGFKKIDIMDEIVSSDWFYIFRYENKYAVAINRDGQLYTHEFYSPNKDKILSLLEKIRKNSDQIHLNRNWKSFDAEDFEMYDQTERDYAFERIY